MKPFDLTPAESDDYDERVAICVEDGKVTDRRAHEIALKQVRPPAQDRLFELSGISR